MGSESPTDSAKDPFVFANRMDFERLLSIVTGGFDCYEKVGRISFLVSFWPTLPEQQRPENRPKPGGFSQTT